MEAGCVREQVRHARMMMKALERQGVFESKQAADAGQQPQAGYAVHVDQIIKHLLQCDGPVSWQKTVEPVLRLRFPDCDGVCESVLSEPGTFEDALRLIEKTDFLLVKRDDDGTLDGLEEIDAVDCGMWIQLILMRLIHVSETEHERKQKEVKPTNRPKRYTQRTDKWTAAPEPESTSRHSSASVTSEPYISIPSNRSNTPLDQVTRAYPSPRSESPVASTSGTSVASATKRKRVEEDRASDHSMPPPSQSRKKIKKPRQSQQASQKAPPPVVKKSQHKAAARETECLIPVPDPEIVAHRRFREAVYKTAAVLSYGEADIDKLVHEYNLYDSLHGPIKLGNTGKAFHLSRSTKKEIENYIRCHKAFGSRINEQGTRVFFVVPVWQNHAERGYSSYSGDSAKLWCICQRPDGDDEIGMLRCCNKQCDIGWWHIRAECGNAVDYKGDDDEWLCPQCVKH